jgi:glycosyltransferase involved in cell wall biosynthesis
MSAGLPCCGHVAKMILHPLVSIVLPTYNGSRYIQQSIDSCLNQTYSNIELIIVDDGSTDCTEQIINSYTDNRIRYIQHQKNAGLPTALNTGVAHATGDYLTWTSDDNFYAPQAIETQLTFLLKNKYDFVYCDIFVMTATLPRCGSKNFLTFTNYKNSIASVHVSYFPKTSTPQWVNMILMLFLRKIMITGYVSPENIRYTTYLSRYTIIVNMRNP